MACAVCVGIYEGKVTITMANNFMYMLMKWRKMLAGRSVFHVDQGAGRYYAKNEVKGYYNDLRGKVSGSTILDEQGIPMNMKATGEWIYFPITIFQYGLGAYDLYLETNDAQYENQIRNILKWTVQQQAGDGSWDAFGYVGSSTLLPMSAMAQGEGASLLIRGYQMTGDASYLEAARRAIDFMLLPVKEGGTADYRDGGIVLEEYIGEGESTVLNGWIFAVFGLYDYCLISGDSSYEHILHRTVQTMTEQLSRFDRGYWSNYNAKGSIASPFYHKLHLAQLRVMHELFGHAAFLSYHDQWLAYQDSAVKSRLAFIVKACQKLMNSNLKGALVK